MNKNQDKPEQNSKAHLKMNHAIEIVWLILTILSLFAGIHKTYHTSIKESYPFFLIALLCIFIYTLRRYFRLSSLNKTTNQKEKD